MNDSVAKEAFEVLARDALTRIQGAGEALEGYRRGIAFYDSRRDDLFTNLESFADAEAALNALPFVRSQYGDQAGKRLSLQFVYGFFGDLPEPIFDQSAFEDAWYSFWQELVAIEWTYIEVSNLQNFRSDSSFLDLGDGISIRGRSFEELRRITGWGDFELGELSGDWEQSGASSHVLIVESKVPKSPDNLVQTNDLAVLMKAQRALMAMRLHREGDIRIGRTFHSRPAAFNLGLGGFSSSGSSVWHPGREYHLEESETGPVRALYETVARFEALPSDKFRNIALALRRFSSIYDRYPADDRVVDAIIAMEALLKLESELSFRLAFRTAGILAPDDDERIAISKEMGEYYKARNAIVHGVPLKPKVSTLIQNDEPLRNTVRRLLVAFLHLVESEKHQPTPRFYKQLDATLQHSRRRAELRKAMGLA